MSDAYDDKVADLYSDNAVIRAFRRYPHGLERSMELTGSQWKALLVKAMPLARAQADRSTFSDVKVSVTGTRAKIKANRYTVRKCYTDTGYYMVVERQPDAKYLIVEEYSETQTIELPIRAEDKPVDRSPGLSLWNCYIFRH